MFLVVLVVLLGLGYWLAGSSNFGKGVAENGGAVKADTARGCEADVDCVHFGKSGECNCGCFNKSYSDWESGGECFCVAPASCRCVGGVCQGVF